MIALGEKYTRLENLSWPGSCAAVLEHFQTPVPGRGVTAFGSRCNRDSKSLTWNTLLSESHYCRNNKDWCWTAAPPSKKALWRVLWNGDVIWQQSVFTLPQKVKGLRTNRIFFFLLFCTDDIITEYFKILYWMYDFLKSSILKCHVLANNSYQEIHTAF